MQAALAAVQRERVELFLLIGLSMVYHAMGQDQASDEALAELIARAEREAAYPGRD